MRDMMGKIVIYILEINPHIPSNWRDNVLSKEERIIIAGPAKDRQQAVELTNELIKFRHRAIIQ